MCSSHLLQLIALCGFEACCGIYFPLQGSIHAKYVPGELRATIMNLYRVGQNGACLFCVVRVSAFFFLIDLCVIEFPQF